MLCMHMNVLPSCESKIKIGGGGGLDSRFYNVKKLEYFRFPLATARKDDSVFMCTEGHVFWKELCQNGGVVG